MRLAPAAHPHVLDEPERLGRAFWISVIFHGALIAGLFATALFHANAPRMGVENPGAGVQITAVSKIPLPTREGRVNPVAHDTESVVPQQPLKLAQQRPAVTPPPPKAIEIPTEQKPKPIRPNREQVPQWQPDPIRPNQVYSHTPEALKSEQFGRAGSSGVGVGPNSPFGNQYGAYAQQIEELISRKWNQAGVSAGPNQRALISFRIHRDGAVSDLEIATTSGSYTLDNSAKRAVLDANPLPPLPPGFASSEATVTFWFQLR